MISIALIGFAGTLFIALMLIQSASSSDLKGWRLEEYIVVFLFLFFVLGIIYTSLSFPAFRSKEKSMAFLMLPSSTSEKYVFEVVTRLVVFIILMPLLYWAVANLEGTIMHYYYPEFEHYKFSFKEAYYKITNADKSSYWLIYDFVQGGAFCLYLFICGGASHFTKSPLVKTLFTFSILIAGYALFCYLIFKGLNLREYNPVDNKVLSIRIRDESEFAAFLALPLTLINLSISCYCIFQAKGEGGLIMEFKNNKGIFLQIADNISEKVMEGKYPPGEKIPSVRDLAAEMGVNPNTVMRTYSELQSRGIIDNKRGVGYYVSDLAMNIIRQWKRQEFFENDLPLIVRQTKLLDITIEELEPYFQ